MKHRFFYIYIAFIVSLLTLLALLLLFSQQLAHTQDTNRSVENTYKVLYKIQSLDTYVNEMETSTRGFLLTKDSIFLKPMISHALVVKEAIDTLKTLISDNGKQSNKLQMIHLNIKLRISLLTQVINKVARNDTSGLVATLLKGKSLMDGLQVQIRELEDGELKALREHSTKKSIAEEITPDYFKIIVSFTSLITLISFFFVNKELRRRLKYQRELEKKINELRRSNEELEQIAHVASHDLQEPLRKIRTFSSRLMVKHYSSLNDEVKNILSRIDISTNRMHQLVNDVVNFTNLIYSTESISKVELDDVVSKTLDELKREIEIDNALINVASLPAVKGYPKQLLLLFRNLLDNSLKFSKKGARPEITISFNREAVQNRLYYHVSVQDNGIGFDNDFGKKIFVLFQRLHAHESGYDGQGIGLAIVQRVMVNHNGLVSASGKPGNGATFSLYFPVADN